MTAILRTFDEAALFIFASHRLLRIRHSAAQPAEYF